MTATARRLIWGITTIEPPIQATTLLQRFRLAVRRFFCALFGHDMVRHFEPDRLSLRCLVCGAQSHGWTIDVNPAFRRRTEPVVTRRNRSVPAAATLRPVVRKHLMVVNTDS
jgi:hypothetical protein